MILSSTKTRRKAVWGPNRTLTLALALIVAFAVTGYAAGANGHSGNATKARDGRPNSLAKAYKIDSELTTRSHSNGQSKTRVIVELQPGAQLPAAYRGYARRNGNLSIINGHVVELPNRLIAELAKHPDVFR